MYKRQELDVLYAHLLDDILQVVHSGLDLGVLLDVDGDFQMCIRDSNLPLLLFPILAVVTMFISTHISMKASGQEMQGSMKLTMYMMPLMYVCLLYTSRCV